MTKSTAASAPTLGQRLGMPASGPQAGSPAVADASHAAARVYSEAWAGTAAPLRSADASWLPERNIAVGRARELIQNNGWLSGEAQRGVDAAIGSTFRLQYMPDWRALGVSRNEARGWARDVEAWWRGITGDTRFPLDAGRRMSWPMLMGLLYRQAQGPEGECLALAKFRHQGRGTLPTRTMIQVIDPDRLCNPTGRVNDARLRGGIEIDGDGAAQVYHIRRAHPGGMPAEAWKFETVAVPKETPNGRLRVIHFFEPLRPEQSRGKAAGMMAALEKAFMLDRYERTEMQAAIVNAVFAAFVRSPFDHAGFAEALGGGGADDNPVDVYQDGRMAFHQEHGNFTLNGMKIPMLYPGEEINFVSAARPNTAFDGFSRTALRYIAAARGTSYEQLTQDWSNTNYSSARAALMESWKYLLSRRGHFSFSVATPIFALALEDALDDGTLSLPRGWPGFWEAFAAYTRCLWIGPGRGWVDPVKEAQAAGIRVENELSTPWSEAAEQGQDYEEVLEGQAAADDLRREMGLPGRQASAMVVDEADPDAQDRAEAASVGGTAAALAAYEARMAALTAAAARR